MQQLFEFPVQSVMTFETFVPCHGNASALHFSHKIVDADDEENLLYLHGPSGSGKSHLLSAIAHQLRQRYPGQAVVIHDCSVLKAGNGGWNGAPALLLDDLHLLPDDADLRGELWQVFNDCYLAGKPIVAAGNCPPRELPHFDDHLISRLLWGLVARSDASDDQSRRMILKKTAADRNVRIPDEVIDYILATTSREVGALILAFDHLYRFSLASQRKITVALARQARESIQGVS